MYRAHRWPHIRPNTRTCTYRCACTHLYLHTCALIYPCILAQNCVLACIPLCACVYSPVCSYTVCLPVCPIGIPTRPLHPHASLHMPIDTPMHSYSSRASIQHPMHCFTLPYAPVHADITPIHIHTDWRERPLHPYRHPYATLHVLLYIPIYT